MTPRLTTTLMLALLATAVLSVSLYWGTRPASAATVVLANGKCDLWASYQSGNDANSGTREAPFKTAQNLIENLAPGQVGCLKGSEIFLPNDNDTVIDLNKFGGGTPGNPITIRTEPGAVQMAKLLGTIRILRSDVIIAGLELDGRSVSKNHNSSAIQILANRLTLLGNDIHNRDPLTNEGTRICIDIGFEAAGEETGRLVADVVIDGNKIHHCGNATEEGSGEHGVYLQQALRTRLVNNYIYANKDRGIQLYFESDQAYIANNVVDGNGTNLLVGGYLFQKNGVNGNGLSNRYSDNNRIENNIFSNATLFSRPGKGERFNIDTFWALTADEDSGLILEDTKNELTLNCIYQEPATSTWLSEADPNSGWSGVKRFDNLVGVNPQYVNRNVFDFRLLETSPCRGKGKGPLPSVAKGTASGVTSGTATVSSTVNPHWTPATYYFQYSTTSNFSSQVFRTGDRNAGSGSLDVVAAENLTGLLPGTTYYYRIVSTNSSDSRTSETSSFTTAQALTIQFSSANYQFSEGEGRATLTVTRAGDTTSSVSVSYQTVDTDTFTVGCADRINNGGSAYARCDFATSVGILSFAPGETTKTITVPIIDDGHAEGAETFQLRLSNASGAGLGSPDVTTVTITDNDAAGAPNPVTTSTSFFVRQQYLDFLSREPDTNGFNAWLGVLAGCPDIFAPPQTLSRCDRIFVSGEGFFRSAEFQLKGFYVFRFYRLAFDRLPEYLEVVSDMSFVAGATEAEVYARRAQLATLFTQRAEFQTRYGGMSNAQYVAALMNRNGLQQITTPDPQAPDTGGKVTLTSTELTSRLDANTLTRAQVLRAIADSDAVGAAEFNNAFVGMQYYGYLRRKPDADGFNAWLRVLQSGDVRSMVNGFLNSTEYKLRFGQP